MAADLALTLSESLDTDEGFVRLDPLDMRLMGVQARDVIGIGAARVSYAVVLPLRMEDRNQRRVQVHPYFARNIGALDGEKIRVLGARVAPQMAESVMVYADDDLDRLYLSVRLSQLATMWQGRVVVAEDRLTVPALDQRPLSVQLKIVKPAEVVQISHQTLFTLAAREEKPSLLPLGGLRDIYRTCQDLAVARLKKDRMAAARAVLLSGPAGCGKSRLVKRLAQDLDVKIEVFDANKLLDQWVESGVNELPFSLAELSRRGPVILLLDHLDALTITEKKATALLSAQRGVAARLCALLDELPMYSNILLFGVASGILDRRFKDHQYFDIVLPVDAPNRLSRHEILAIATREMPLAESVDLARLAAMTAGATARDLSQLASAASILASDVKIGMGDFLAALRPLSLSAANEVRCDLPDMPWHDVAGLDDVKQLMRETLTWSLRYHEKFAEAGVRPPRSVLLSGGPGTGKTSLVRALAGVMPMNYIEVDCPLLAAFDFEKAVQFIRDTFAMARRKTPCLVFFDDIDVLFEIGTAAFTDVPHLHPIVAQLLAELDDLALFQGIVVMAATNRPDRLTKEVLRAGRFDYAVTLPMPDMAARKKILQIHARKLPLAADVDFDRLAQVTQGMSSSEIANLCGRVGLLSLRQSLSNPDGDVLPPVVNAELFEQCLRGRKT